QFKDMVKRELDVQFSNSFNSDCEFVHNGELFLIEYENSSRGLISNFAKIISKKDKIKNKTNLIFIRTLRHQRDCNNDYKYLKSLIKEISVENLKISIINEQDFDLFCMFSDIKSARDG